jgi:hypothetical protein
MYSLEGAEQLLTNFKQERKDLNLRVLERQKEEVEREYDG